MVLKLTNPIWKTNKTRNEACVLIEIHKRTNLLVPKIYTWEDQKERSEIEYEFILMECLKGESLFQYWNIMSIMDQKKIISQIVDVLVELRKFKFKGIGNFTKIGRFFLLIL